MQFIRLTVAGMVGQKWQRLGFCQTQVIDYYTLQHIEKPLKAFPNTENTIVLYHT